MLLLHVVSRLGHFTIFLPLHFCLCVCAEVQSPVVLLTGIRSFVFVFVVDAPLHTRIPCAHTNAGSILAIHATLSDSVRNELHHFYVIPPTFVDVPN